MPLGMDLTSEEKRLVEYAKEAVVIAVDILLRLRDKQRANGKSAG